MASAYELSTSFSQNMMIFWPQQGTVCEHRANAYAGLTFDKSWGRRTSNGSHFFFNLKTTKKFFNRQICDEHCRGVHVLTRIPFLCHQRLNSTMKLTYLWSVLVKLLSGQSQQLTVNDICVYNLQEGSSYGVDSDELCGRIHPRSHRKSLSQFSNLKSH